MDKLEQYLPPGTKCFYRDGGGRKITCVVVSIEEARKCYTKRYNYFFADEEDFYLLKEEPIFGYFSNCPNEVNWMPFGNLIVTEIPDIKEEILWD